MLGLLRNDKWFKMLVTNDLIHTRYKDASNLWYLRLLYKV